MTTQPRGALEAAISAGRSIVSELTELNLMRVSGSYSYEDLLTAVNGAQQNAQHFCETHLPALLSAGAEGDDNNLPEPFPRVHSYDPSGARRTVTVQWGEESFVSYVRYGDRSTWKEIPPINETPVERPAPSAGVGQKVVTGLLEDSFGPIAGNTQTASAAGEGFVSVPKEEVLRIARMAEGLKRECGMDPESPQAIRNGQYMNISHALRTMLAAQGGSDG